MSIYIADDSTDASVSFSGSYPDEIREWLQLHYQVDLTQEGLSVSISDAHSEIKKAEATG